MNPRSFPNQRGRLVHCACHVRGSISKEFLEPLRRKGSVACRVLNVTMPEVRAPILRLVISD